MVSATLPKSGISLLEVHQTRNPVPTSKNSIAVDTTVIMTRFEPNPEALQELKSKVVVLTGGSTGIGAATVRLLHSVGAHVVFGDINTSAAESIVSSLGEANKVTFVQCNAAKYQDNVALFKVAFEKFGRVDHGIANAGLVERPGWFDAGMSLEDADKEPSTAVLDVNLTGVLYFSRVACAYLSQGPSRDRSLTLLSSVAGFEECPGLFVYQASKHGVLGLMRALRLYAPEVFGVRVNAVCPWMTKTGMVAGIEKGWEAAGLPTNEPEDIANIVAGLASAGSSAGPGMLKNVKSEGDSGRGLGGAYNAAGYAWGETESRGGVNGRAIYIEGGKGWDVEEGLAYTQPYWLGKGPCERLVQGQKELGSGSDWT
jgi:NAD(P)-dependent dehydrogenase (short-subunit alcohol dehydrogenase family)